LFGKLFSGNCDETENTGNCRINPEGLNSSRNEPVFLRTAPGSSLCVPGPYSQSRLVARATVVAKPDPAVSGVSVSSQYPEKGLLYSQSQSSAETAMRDPTGSGCLLRTDSGEADPMIGPGPGTPGGSPSVLHAFTHRLAILPLQLCRRGSDASIRHDPSRRPGRPI